MDLRQQRQRRVRRNGSTRGDRGPTIDGLSREFGFECTTFVRTASELRGLVAEAPFDPATDDTHFVTFLKSSPTATQARDLEAMSNSFDTLVVRGRDVHWLMHGRSSDSPLKKRDWERILGPNTSTSRNTTMLGRLVAKFDD